MTKYIEIYNEHEELENTILAEEDFAEMYYPGRWKLASNQPILTESSPTEWLIDIGPFFDRFGSTKMQILTSSDAGVKAVISDLQVRKWIDLKRPDVYQGLQYVGTVISSVDSALTMSVLNNPVQPEENLALRKLYFQ